MPVQENLATTLRFLAVSLQQYLSNVSTQMFGETVPEEV